MEYYSTSVLLGAEELQALIDGESDVIGFVMEKTDKPSLLRFTSASGMMGLFIGKLTDTLGYSSLKFLNYDNHTYEELEPEEECYTYCVSILNESQVELAASDINKFLLWAKENPLDASNLIYSWEGSVDSIGEATAAGVEQSDEANLTWGDGDSPKELFAYLRLVLRELNTAKASGLNFVQMHETPN